MTYHIPPLAYEKGTGGNSPSSRVLRGSYLCPDMSQENPGALGEKWTHAGPQHWRQVLSLGLTAAGTARL